MTEDSTHMPVNYDEFPSEEESPGDVWPGMFDKKRVTALQKNPHFLKKKRVHSASFSNSGSNGLTYNGMPSDIHTLTAVLHRSHIGGTRSLHGKNSRRSRNGRRFPSKRGGKNTDDPADVLEEVSLDHDDPDYDSDTEDPVTLGSLDLAPSDEDFERTFKHLMNEFFVHGITREVTNVLSELNLAPHQRRRLPYLAVTMALQHKQTECELTSELLSDLCGQVINQAYVQQGFILVLSELNELTIDFPKAPEYVGRFIARAIIDDILPPKFIESQKSILSHSPSFPHHNESKTDTIYSGGCSPTVYSSTGDCVVGSEPRARLGTRNLSDSANGTSVEHTSSTCVSSGIGSASSLTTSCVTYPEVALTALTKAENWLTLSRAFVRLDNIWGVPGGPKAIKRLTQKIHGLLRSYFASEDMSEATESLIELDSPHFHHELVFQAIVMAIELSTDTARSSLIRLLAEFYRSGVTTAYQLALGIRRVYSELPDLQLDVPQAYNLMERFLKASEKAGLVTKELVAEMPMKPRKRFISETDSVYRSRHQTGPL